jgi:hypothetical protein
MDMSTTQNVVNAPLIPQYLSVLALAKRWQCDEKLVYQEIAAKRLAGLRIGKKLLRIELSEIQRYERDYRTSKEQEKEK